MISIQTNKRTGAATQSTLGFNSMCRVGGAVVGATSQGLFLTGAQYTTDNGTAIASMFRSGTFDLGVESKKRFRYFYLGLDITGSLKITVYGDGELAGEYTATGVSGQGIQNIRVPISRMVKARYWYWQIENIDGSFFTLYSIKALPVIAHPGRNSY